MSCCGKKREQLLAVAPSPPLSRSAAPPARQAQAALQSRVFFEYVGHTGMTVIGPATGKQYRFDRPGSRIEVDLRDRRSLEAVPQLRQLGLGDFRTAR